MHLGTTDMNPFVTELIHNAQTVHHLQRCGVDDGGPIPFEGSVVALDEMDGNLAAGKLTGEEKARRSSADDEDGNVRYGISVGIIESGGFSFLRCHLQRMSAGGSAPMVKCWCSMRWKLRKMK